MIRFAAAAAAVIWSVLFFVNPVVAQPDSIYRLSAGTRIRLTVDTEVSSKVASVNDTFLAAVAKPVSVRDVVVVPVGTVLEGRVSRVSGASAGGQNGTLDVVFEKLRISNTTRPIEGVMITSTREKGSTAFNLLSVLGGVAAGTAVGAAGSPRGALIGAGIGAGAGTGIALLRKGKEARIRKGQEFEIELKREVVLPVLDY